MKSLKEIIYENLEQRKAIGHFNFSTFEVAQAIVNAAKKLNIPVILGLSEKEREFVGVREAVDWVAAVNKDLEEERKNFSSKNPGEVKSPISNVSIFLNADHTYSFEKVKEAVDLGFDMVIFDNAEGDVEKNILVAKKCREYIDKHNAGNFLKKLFQKISGVPSKQILFEAELGYIGKSSKVLTELPQGLQKTDPKIAKNFVDEVRPDLLAPAIGNVHGMLKDIPDPNLDEKLCQEIFNAVKIPLVLHGASGNSKEDIQACIKSGVAVVHVNTEIRLAYKESLKKHVEENSEVAPYKYINEVEEDVQKVVEEKLKIFNFN